MFECDREKFVKLKNISNAPSWEALKKFYSDNHWRINVFEDPGAISCYERLYYFWTYYKEPGDKLSQPISPVWALLFFGLMFVGKS